MSGSGGDKDRLKETQSINKSLSALGDVVERLAQVGEGGKGGGEHVPFRNSKVCCRMNGLTFLFETVDS